MKSIIISIACSLLFVLSIQAAMANKAEVNQMAKESEKVDAKCHVSLIDGTEAIIFWGSTRDHVSKLTTRIVGKKVATQKSLEKIKVYKAFECVLEEESFSSLKAQTLDDKTPR